jgi:hypothetical protein
MDMKLIGGDGMKRRLIWSLLLLVGFVSSGSVGQDSAWEASIQAGHEAMAKRQYPEAEKAFREALFTAEKFGEGDARFSGTLLLLAQACDGQSRKDEAEALARRAVDDMDKVLKAYRPKRADDQLDQADASSYLFDKTGDIFASHHKYPEAEMLYKRVIQIRERSAEKKKKPHDNEDIFRFWLQVGTDAQGKLAEAHEKLGDFYLSENKFPDAAATYEIAQKIREANPDTDKRALSVTFSNLATSYAAQAKYAQAEPLYQRSLALLEQANWMEKPEAVRTMQNYALLLKKTGREEEARSMAEKAAALSRKIGQTAQ